MYETGGMRRVHLRGRENILKRLVVHAAAFNLSLILRRNCGAGTPREFQALYLHIFALLWMTLEENSLIDSLFEINWLTTGHGGDIRETLASRRSSAA